MMPVVFRLGPLAVYSFGLMIAAGLMLSLALLTRRAQRTGFPDPPQLGADLVTVSVASGFLGARLYYVFEHAKDYAPDPLMIFAIWEGGLIFYGGVAGSLLGLLIFSRVKKLPYLKVLDFLLPFVVLTQAFGRFGCFLNGCCFGSACALPWAVRFPDSAGPVHPSQLYEAVLNALLFFYLNRRYDTRRFDGEIAAFYFMGYAALRFIVEFTRGNNPFLGAFTVNQWISAALLAGGALLYALMNPRKFREAAKPK